MYFGSGGKLRKPEWVKLTNEHVTLAKTIESTNVNRVVWTYLNCEPAVVRCSGVDGFNHHATLYLEFVHCYLKINMLSIVIS